MPASDHGADNGAMSGSTEPMKQPSGQHQPELDRKDGHKAPQRPIQKKQQELNNSITNELYIIL
jgi:hypothetical protein